MSYRPHRNPIFAADIRELGGVVSVHTSRDRCDGTPVFRVGHISGGGDVAFLSLPLMLEDHATAAARVLAEFVGGVAENVSRSSDAEVARETSDADLAGPA
jgi:hypothetical protein